MEAKDGSDGFDSSSTYTGIQAHALIAYRVGDGAEARDVRVVFEPEADATIVRETLKLKQSTRSICSALVGRASLTVS